METRLIVDQLLSCVPNPRKGAVLLLAAMVVSCISGSAGAPTQADVIDTMWRYHTSVVRTAVGAEFELGGDDFARSIAFLERVTGIYSDTANWAGRIPTKELPNTLRLWEEWYERHRSELRLSPDGCGIVLKQPGGR